MHRAALFTGQRGLQTAMVGVFLLVCAVFVHVLTHDFVRWDDGMLIYENPAVRGITPWTIRWVFTHFDPELYIPLTFITYQINYLIGGIDPFIYHLTNLLLHAANAALVVWLFQLLTGRLRIAVLCGILFAIHPLHTEAVAWASGRKDVLSTAFFLGSWISMLLFWENGSKKSYRSGIVLFLLGLLSKVMVATLPAVLLLQALTERRPLRQTLKDLLPHIVLAAVFIGIAFVGKEQLVTATTLPQKILMACLSSVFYIKKILWPDSFSLLYPYLGEISITSPDFYIPVVIVSGMIALSLLLWQRRPLLMFCVFGYLGTLAPTFLNFTKGGDLDVYFASDRYAYIPSMFVFLGIAALLDAGSVFLENRAPTVQKKSPFLIITILLTFTLAFLSVRQSFVWENTRTLFAHVIKVYPRASHVAHNNLGNMERLEGNLAAAIDEFNQALAVRPHAKIWSNLAAVYRKQQKIPEARDAYTKALALDPESAYALAGLGVIAAQEGKVTDAISYYERALKADPTVEEAAINLGALFAAQKDFEAAVREYKRALSINPFQVQALYNLGVAYTALNDLEAAKTVYEEAVGLRPDFVAARINLGLLLANTGDRAGAIEQFESVLRTDPQNKVAAAALRQLQ